MDPGDLLSLEVPILPSLPRHNDENARVLALLSQHFLKLKQPLKYTRWSIADRFQGFLDDADAEEWNQEMANVQKIRTRPPLSPQPDLDGLGMGLGMCKGI